LTSAFVELAITSMTLWSKHSEKTTEERGDAAPFRLQNYTGLTMLVWPESRDLNKPVSGVKQLKDGDSVPWRFENANRAREVR
jgi:vacuolar protein sorting-associated protein 13A/C